MRVSPLVEAGQGWAGLRWAGLGWAGLGPATVTLSSTHSAISHARQQGQQAAIHVGPCAPPNAAPRLTVVAMLAGLYYPEGSLKAELCVSGRRQLYSFCAESGVAHARLGKLVVAPGEAQLPALGALCERGRRAGVHDLQVLPADLCEFG